MVISMGLGGVKKGILDSKNEISPVFPDFRLCGGRGGSQSERGKEKQLRMRKASTICAKLERHAEAFEKEML